MSDFSLSNIFSSSLLTLLTYVFNFFSEKKIAFIVYLYSLSGLIGNVVA